MESKNGSIEAPYISGKKARSRAHKQLHEELEQVLIPDIANLVVDYTVPTRIEDAETVQVGDKISGKKEGEWQVFSKSNGKLIAKRLYKNNVLRREIRYEYRKNGKLADIMWYKGGKLHNEGGPAMLVFQPDGTVNHAAWYLNDKPIRDLLREESLGRPEIRERIWRKGKPYSYILYTRNLVYDKNNRALDELDTKYPELDAELEVLRAQYYI